MLALCTACVFASHACADPESPADSTRLGTVCSVGGLLLHVTWEQVNLAEQEVSARAQLVS